MIIFYTHVRERRRRSSGNRWIGIQNCRPPLSTPRLNDYNFSRKKPKQMECLHDEALWRLFSQRIRVERSIFEFDRKRKFIDKYLDDWYLKRDKSVLGSQIHLIWMWLNARKHKKCDKSGFTFFERLTNCLWYKDPSLFMTLIFILMVQSHEVNQSSLNWDISMATDEGCGRERVETSSRLLVLKPKSFLNLCKWRILENFMHLNQFLRTSFERALGYAKMPGFQHSLQFFKNSII